MTAALKTHAKNFWQASKDFALSGMVLIGVRIYLGIFYIQTGTNKLGRGDFGLGYTESLTGFVQGVVNTANETPDSPHLDFYVTFLSNVVLEYPAVFTILVSWGETLLGFALLFGFSVRLAGVLGFFMALNFLMASGRGFYLPSFDALLAYTLLTLALARAGRTLGLDVFLAKWKPKFWAW